MKVSWPKGTKWPCENVTNEIVTHTIGGGGLGPDAKTNEELIKKPLPDYRLMKKKSGELVLQQRFTLESWVRYDLVWEDVPTVEEG